MAAPILKTRLYRPKINGKQVNRHQLIRKLDEGKDKSLSLVVAPTGYGKSVVVDQWLEKLTTKHCWITLDEDLNDLTTFLAYIIYGLQSQFQEALKNVQRVLNESDVSSLEVLSTLLINDLDEINEDFILVLDDYHCIKDHKVNGLINSILKYPPEKLHLVIISRWDPAIQLSSHRTYGLINDLRQSDLSFTLDEVKEFTYNMLEESLSNDDCKLLLNKTEGWAVGLKLAVCDLNNCNGMPKSIQQLKLDQNYFQEYILDELFHRQSDHAKHLLVSSVIAPRFSKDLLLAILENADLDKPGFDADIFDNMVREWQFIIPLDNQGEWYRFHHIIHDFLVLQLQKSFSTEQIQRLHRKAGLFFENQGQMESAIRQAVLAHDIDLIGGIFERNKYQILTDEKLSRLHKWIELIPGEWVEENVELLLTRTFLYDDTNNYEAMQKDLELSERMLLNMEEDHQNLTRYWGEYYACLAISSFESGDLDQSIESSKKAMRLLKSHPGFIRTKALHHCVMALQTSGQGNKANFLIEQNLKNVPNSNYRAIAHILFIQAVLYAMEGDLSNLFATASRIKVISQKHDLPASHISASYFLFGVHYRQNKLSKAYALLDDFNDFIYVGWPVLVLNYLFLKGFALNAKGDLPGYRNTLQQVQDFTKTLDRVDLPPIIKAYEAEIAMMQGDHKKAQELSEEADFDPYPPYGYYYIPQLTRVRLLIYSGIKENQEKALEELNHLVELGYTRHSFNLLAKALPLRALLFKLTGKLERARLSLEEALSISRTHGYIRNFLDLGEVMHAMIKEHIRKKPKDAFLTKVEKAFHPEREIYHKFEVVKKNGVAKVEAGINLSKRESEILTLLSKGYQNKEIASELFISNEAVKKSLYRLYMKLDVNNRSTAIMHAMDLGLVAAPV